MSRENCRLAMASLKSLYDPSTDLGNGLHTNFEYAPPKDCGRNVLTCYKC